jgi:hypothetical protein
MAMSAFVIEHHPARSSCFFVIDLVPPQDELIFPSSLPATGEERGSEEMNAKWKEF